MLLLSNYLWVFLKMGNSLGGNSLGGGMSGSFAGGYGGSQTQCCDGVVDPISLLVTIGAIAGLAQFLRQAVIDAMVMMGAGRQLKRSKHNFWIFIEIDEVIDSVIAGNYY